MSIIKKIVVVLILFYAGVCFSQDRDTLAGRVLSGNNPVFDVYVINKATGAETKTARNGNFIILAKVGDAIIVYSDKTEVREFQVNKNAFNENPFLVAVNYKAVELEEVIINDTVDEVSLGLVPEGQKQYTPAERHLQTAGEFKPIMLLKIAAGGMPVDPIINAITGRTKMLKKALETEKKEFVIDKIYGFFSEEELKSFNIPEEYVKGFIFYIVEDERFTDAVKAENTELITFRMQVLAKEYTEYLQKENE